MIDSEHREHVDNKWLETLKHTRDPRVRVFAKMMLEFPPDVRACFTEHLESRRILKAEKQTESEQ